jgi:GxxExxY protein
MFTGGCGAASRVHHGPRMETEQRAPFSDRQTQAIIGAAIDVHKKMGRGFLEAVYPECLAIEFHRRGIPFNREVRLPVHYDGILRPVHFKVDFICFDEVLVEVKALAIMTTREHAQLMNYLRASGLHRGLLLNFGADFLATKRFVWQLPAELDSLNRT